MSALDDKLEALKVSWQAALPNRIITREFKNASDRDRDDLKKGIYTLLFQGLPRFGALGASPQTVKIFLLGQFVVEENETGAEVEAKELEMVDEITEWLRAAEAQYPTIPSIKAIELASSAQMEHPYGWVAVVLEMSWTKKCTT